MCSSQQMLEKLADLAFKLEDALRLGLQPPEGSWVQIRSPARWPSGPPRLGMAPPEYFSAGSFTPNPAPPPRTRVVLSGLPVEPAAVAEPEGGVELNEEAV